LEAKKTLVDKIDIQEQIVHKIIVRLRIVESPPAQTIRTMTTGKNSIKSTTFWGRFINSFL